MAQSNCLSSPITYPHSTDAERQNSTTRLCWSSGLIQSVHWGMGDQDGRCGDHILYLPTPLYPAVGRCLRCTATCFLRRVLPVSPAIGRQATEASGEEGQGAGFGESGCCMYSDPRARPYLVSTNWNCPPEQSQQRRQPVPSHPSCPCPAAQACGLPAADRASQPLARGVRAHPVLRSVEKVV
jgi:hypothetical protein